MKNEMRNILIVMALMLATLPVEAGKVSFKKYFTGGTLRIDCVREGNAEGDTVWVSRWVDRYADWHGSRTQLIDPFDNGVNSQTMRSEVKSFSAKPTIETVFCGFLV